MKTTIASKRVINAIAGGGGGGGGGGGFPGEGECRGERGRGRETNGFFR